MARDAAANDSLPKSSTNFVVTKRLCLLTSSWLPPCPVPPPLMVPVARASESKGSGAARARAGKKAAKETSGRSAAVARAKLKGRGIILSSGVNATRQGEVTRPRGEHKGNRGYGRAGKTRCV